MTFELHHVSIPCRDLERSAAFYEGVLGLRRLDRPGFNFDGVWYALGDRQLHLILNKDAPFVENPIIQLKGAHFALATADFDGTIARLEAHGYSGDRAEGDPMQLRIVGTARVGFNQLFLLDPDLNTIEINEPGR